MLRETKIGLIVGMFVVILIGILVSDHLSEAYRQDHAELGYADPPEIEPLTPPNLDPYPSTPQAEDRAESLTADASSRDSLWLPDPEPFGQVAPEDPPINVEPYELEYTGYGHSIPGPDEQIASLGGEPRIGRGFLAIPTIDGSATLYIREGVPDTLDAARPLDVGDAPPITDQARPVGDVGPSAGSEPRADDARSRRVVTDPAPAQPRRQQRVHYIAEGETLSGISSRYYGTIRHADRIIEANPDKIPSPDRIQIGVRIVIPDVPADAPAGNAADRAEARRETPSRPADEIATREYEVQAGDTFASLAERFYGSQNHWPKLHELNKQRVPNANRLRSGSTILVPAD